MRMRPLEPGDKGYGPESRAFFKAFMESEPGDAFDVASKGKLTELAEEWERKKGPQDRRPQRSHDEAMAAWAAEVKRLAKERGISLDGDKPDDVNGDSSPAPQ
jgi:hypothetical protein